MSHDRRDNDWIADHRKTSARRTSYLNLGTTPRVSASHVVNNEERNGAAVALPDREPRNFPPLQQQILALLLRAVVPEERDKFEKQFGRWLWPEMGSIILMPSVLAILRLAGFHGLTNVNIPSNYGTWVTCSQTPGWNPITWTSST
jgi:hypothetical protein